MSVYENAKAVISPKLVHTHGQKQMHWPYIRYITHIIEALIATYVSNTIAQTLEYKKMHLYENEKKQHFH